MKAELGNNLPEIKDSFLFVLSNKLAEDLLTIKGKTILRNELSKKVNQILDPGKITNIWFTGFVME
ncbi:MAG: flagellar basal body-associated FliL family protein [Deltaproteobacteria bacterium]|nr:flagellar basal body-associated FliL family protein [Deltaproteobacteria bacterium]